jgi:DNA polymerase-1
MGKLVLIDGHAILHRAYHALPKTLTNRHGQLVNAVYGFTRMLLRVIEDLKPQYLAVAFDRPEPTFRHQEYVGYQVQRPKTDQELKDQIEIVKEVLKAFNIPTFEKIGFEADDIIGTLARQAKVPKRKVKSAPASPRRSRGRAKRKTRSKKAKLKKREKIKTIIVTGDKDIFQLIDESTFVYTPQKGFSQAQTFGRKKAKEALGVWPKQVVDYKALAGDASDNYPGVPGIGPKTATKLLEKFKTLKEIYRALGSKPSVIRKSIQVKLLTGKESALLSQKLAKIVTNAPVKLKLKDCLLHDYDQEKVFELFKKLGFKSLMDKLPGAEGGSGGKKEKKQKKGRGEQMRLV